jgi:hypothetical protein
MPNLQAVSVIVTGTHGEGASAGAAAAHGCCCQAVPERAGVLACLAVPERAVLLSLCCAPACRQVLAGAAGAALAARGGVHAHVCWHRGLVRNHRAAAARGALRHRHRAASAALPDAAARQLLFRVPACGAGGSARATAGCGWGRLRCMQRGARRRGAAAWPTAWRAAAAAADCSDAG